MVTAGLRRRVVADLRLLLTAAHADRRRNDAPSRWLLPAGASRTAPRPLGARRRTRGSRGRCSALGAGEGWIRCRRGRKPGTRESVQRAAIDGSPRGSPGALAAGRARIATPPHRRRRRDSSRRRRAFSCAQRGTEPVAASDRRLAYLADPERPVAVPGAGCWKLLRARCMENVRDRHGGAQDGGTAVPRKLRRFPVRLRSHTGSLPPGPACAGRASPLFADRRR